jgi:two-component system OmpR family response regulator/two-component system response regulator QseB
MGLRVERACDGVDALAMAKSGSYAVVVLDVNLPRLGGLEVLKAVRRTKPYLPIVVVSEFVGPAAEAECINMGADDFISKSFHDNSFQARVRRAIWHGSLVGEVTSLRWGEVSVDDANQIVFYAGKVVELSEKEYNILLPLVKAHGRRVDPDVLEMAAWGDVKRMSKRLETKISYIRDKFEKVGAPRDLIDSNRGTGYVLKA